MFLFVCFDFLHSSQQCFSHVGMGLPGVEPVLSSEQSANLNVTELIPCILAHLITISEILACDRKSYLTHVILPRLSHEGRTLVVLELTHMVVK